MFRRRFELRTTRLSENRDLGLETRDKGEFGEELYFIHTKHKKELEFFLYEKYSQNYAREMFNTLQKVFIQEKARNLDDIKNIILEKRINERSVKTAYRVFLNYIEEKELLDDSYIQSLRKKIKLNISTKIDSYVPNIKDINKSLSKLVYLNNKYYILYKLILESGCRPSELKEIIINFDKSRIEEWDDDIIIYRNFYLRNSKNSFYLFFTKKTFDEFLNIHNELSMTFFNSFKEKVIRDTNIINLKYLRKYQFTLMIENNISFEIANFIQGRTSQNIGFNHYLSKKVIAVREYQKIIKFFLF